MKAIKGPLEFESESNKKQSHIQNDGFIHEEPPFSGGFHSVGIAALTLVSPCNVCSQSILSV